MSFTKHHPELNRKEEWLTPPEIIEALGPFDLDPCAPVDRPWDTATWHYTIEDDGLSHKWFGYVWCNPPYGRKTSTWLQRMAEHNNGITLIFARTETRMFFEWVWPRASCLLFLQGRLSFYDVRGNRGPVNAGAPSVLVAYGELGKARLSHSGVPGQLIDLERKTL